jgi:hypothetical protein
MVCPKGTAFSEEEKLCADVSKIKQVKCLQGRA